jgi:endonuclease/exonuclease/phosphatase family metal-dependent hydrolase
MIIAFARKGQDIGQYPEEDVPALLASGEILYSDRYWHKGMSEWVKVYERWSEPEAPEPVPKKTPSPPKGAAPVIKVEQALKPARSGPGPLFYLIAALVIGGGLYWFLFHQQPPPERPAQVAPAEQEAAAEPTPALPAATATPLEAEEATEETASAEPEAPAAPSDKDLALAWLKDNPQFTPRRVTLEEPREFILKRNGLVRGSTMVPAGASARVDAWDDKTVTAGFAAEPRVLPLEATDFVARAITVYQREKGRPKVLEAAPAPQEEESEAAAVVPAKPVALNKSKITVVSWNLEWYPGRTIESSPEEQEAHREAAKEELKKIDPDIFLGQEIASWEEFIDLCSVVPDLQVAAVSHHLRRGEVARQQTTIASKLPVMAAWYDDWKRARPQPPRGYTAAVVEIPGTDKLVLFYSVHLKSNRARSEDETKSNYEQREESAKQLLAHVEEMENNAFKGRIAGVVIGGDMNTNHDGQFDDDTIDMLTEAGFVNTWENVPRKKRETWIGSGRYEPTTFDYILTKGFGSPVAELVDIPEEASDHRPVMVEISLTNK